MSPSTAAIRSRCAWVASTLETSPDGELVGELVTRASRVELGGRRRGAHCSSPRIDETLNRPTLVLGGSGERLLGGERRADDIGSRHRAERDGVAGRRDIGRRDLGHLRHRLDDHTEFAGQLLRSRRRSARCGRGSPDGVTTSGVISADDTRQVYGRIGRGRCGRRSQREGCPSGGGAADAAQRARRGSPGARRAVAGRRRRAPGGRWPMPISAMLRNDSLPAVK